MQKKTGLTRQGKKRGKTTFMSLKKRQKVANRTPRKPKQKKNKGTGKTRGRPQFNSKREKSK